MPAKTVLVTMPPRDISGRAILLLAILGQLMAKTINWEARIGRRLLLRDLHVLLAFDQSGSMAKAAALLGITQSAISQMVADLEQTLGVRLLDRTTRGVEATVYGRSLLRYGKAA